MSQTRPFPLCLSVSYLYTDIWGDGPHAPWSSLSYGIILLIGAVRPLRLLTVDLFAGPAMRRTSPASFDLRWAGLANRSRRPKPGSLGMNLAASHRLVDFVTWLESSDERATQSRHSRQVLIFTRIDVTQRALDGAQRWFHCPIGHLATQQSDLGGASR